MMIVISFRILTHFVDVRGERHREAFLVQGEEGPPSGAGESIDPRRVVVEPRQRRSEGGDGGAREHSAPPPSGAILDHVAAMTTTRPHPRRRCIGEVTGGGAKLVADVGPVGAREDFGQERDVVQRILAQRQRRPPVLLKQIRKGRSLRLACEPIRRRHERVVKYVPAAEEECDKDAGDERAEHKGDEEERRGPPAFMIVMVTRLRASFDFLIFLLSAIIDQDLHMRCLASYCSLVQQVASPHWFIKKKDLINRRDTPRNSYHPIWLPSIERR